VEDKGQEEEFGRIREKNGANENQVISEVGKRMAPRGGRIYIYIYHHKMFLWRASSE
jgi:hypothetical protein